MHHKRIVVGRLQVDIQEKNLGNTVSRHGQKYTHMQMQVTARVRGIAKASQGYTQ